MSFLGVLTDDKYTGDKLGNIETRVAELVWVACLSLSCPLLRRVISGLPQSPVLDNAENKPMWHPWAGYSHDGWLCSRFLEETSTLRLEQLPFLSTLVVLPGSINHAIPAHPGHLYWHWAAHQAVHGPVFSLADHRPAAYAIVVLWEFTAVPSGLAPAYCTTGSTPRSILPLGSRSRRA